MTLRETTPVIDLMHAMAEERPTPNAYIDETVIINGQYSQSQDILAPLNNRGLLSESILDITIIGEFDVGQTREVTSPIPGNHRQTVLTF